MTFATSSREARLVEAIETAREEIAQLKEALAPKLATPPAWKLTGQEELLFRHLAAREMVTRESAMIALHGLEYDADPRLIDVHISRLRRKVPGVAITTIWGRGHTLEDRARWRALLEGGDMQTTAISFALETMRFKAVEARAATLGYKTSAYARMLFDAAYLARCADEKGEESGDAELDRAVRSVFLMADADAATISAVVGVSEATVARILAGWRTFFASRPGSSPGGDGASGRASEKADGLRSQPRPAAVAPPKPEPSIDRTVRAGDRAEARPAFGAAEKVTISRMWIEGESAAQIGAAVGGDADTIRAFAANHRDLCPARATTAKAAAPVKPKRGWTQDDRFRLKELWAEGREIEEIAEALGRTFDAIKTYAKDHRGLCPVRNGAEREARR